MPISSFRGHCLTPRQLHHPSKYINCKINLRSQKLRWALQNNRYAKFLASLSPVFTQLKVKKQEQSTLLRTTKHQHQHLSSGAGCKTRSTYPPILHSWSASMLHFPCTFAPRRCFIQLLVFFVPRESACLTVFSELPTHPGPTTMISWAWVPICCLKKPLQKPGYFWLPEPSHSG